MHRLLNSASGRSFVLIPLASMAFEVVQLRRRPRPRLLYLPLPAAGYGLYLWAGAYRTRHGGGGPGMGRPPDRLVADGPYGRSRNPMYLGHMLFLVGLALTLRSPLAAVLGAGQALTLLRHVQIDEERLAQQFGAEYADYRARVSRWFSLGRVSAPGPESSPRRDRTPLGATERGASQAAPITAMKASGAKRSLIPGSSAS